MSFGQPDSIEGISGLKPSSYELTYAEEQFLNFVRKRGH